MTAPINFPSISAPQLAPPKRGQLDGFAEFLTALQGQREERADRQERLNMERRRLDSALETDKLTKQETQRKLDIADMRLQAEKIAEPFSTQVALHPSADKDDIAAVREQLVRTTDKKLLPYTLEAFDDGILKTQDVMFKIAQRESAQSKARVDVATEKPDISKAGSDAKRAATEAKRSEVQLQHDVVVLNTAKVQQALANIEKTYGAGRVQRSMAVLNSGGTIAEALRLEGLPVPDGVDPNFRLPKLEGSGSDKAKQEGLAGQALAGSTLLELAKHKKLSLKADIFRSMAGKAGVIGAVGRHATNKNLEPEERQALQGYNLLGQAYAQHVTGATATDSQMQVFNNTIIAFEDDDDETYKQKIVIQRLLPRLISRGLKPSQIAAAMVEEAERIGMEPGRIAILRAQIPLAAMYENSPEYGKVVPPTSVVPDSSAAARRYKAPPIPQHHRQ